MKKSLIALALMACASMAFAGMFPPTSTGELPGAAAVTQTVKADAAPAIVTAAVAVADVSPISLTPAVTNHSYLAPKQHAVIAHAARYLGTHAAGAASAALERWRT